MRRGTVFITTGKKRQGQAASVRYLIGEQFIEALSFNLTKRREYFWVDADMFIGYNIWQYNKENHREAEEP